MNEDEKKAIKYLSESVREGALYYDSELHEANIDIILNLIENQDKMFKLIAEEIKERWNVELNLDYFRKKVKDNE